MTNQRLIALAALLLLIGVGFWYVNHTQHRSTDQQILLRKAK